MHVNHVLGSGIKNFLRKWRKTSEIIHFDLFFVIKNPLQKFEHTHLYKNSSNVLINQVSCDSGENFQENRRKPT